MGTQRRYFTEVSIPTKHRLQLAFARLFLLLIRGVQSAWRLLRPVLRPIWLVLRAIGRFILRFVFLPIYTLSVLLKLRLEKVVSSARGLFFFLFTNRYAFHAVLLCVSLATIGSQLTTHTASASNAGQNSLLYTLVTQGQDESVDEPLYIQPAHSQSSYLGTGTIQALPNVDFDYEPTPTADLTIPGTVAVMPTVDNPTPDTATPNNGIADLPPEPATAPEPRRGTEDYTVKAGDTVASIAQRFGVNIGTIIWANNLSRRAAINPGDVLRIPAESGVLHVVKRGETLGSIAKKYTVDVDDITRANNSLPTLAVGQEILIPGASPLTTADTNVSTRPIAITKPTTVATKPTTASQPAIRPNIPLSTITNKAVDVYQELANSETDTRTKPADEIVDTVKKATKLLWPTDLHVINQYYGWAHTGVDIDGDYANAIFAADDGVVETAGWNNGGYGLMIMIDHQNGIKTRYGHSSKLFVKAGDHVKRGQVIAMVGTTGRSTGTHLHFEVYVNGVRTNPLGYIR